MYKEMKKHWKLILTVVAILLSGLLIWLLIDYFSVPRLPFREKEKIEQVYFEEHMASSEKDYADRRIIWYDENGYVEEENVWRYVGTYGNSYAFLRIGSGIGATMDPIESPILLRGLSRTVYYPCDADIMLYHTTRKFTYAEVLGSDYSFDGTIRMYPLHEIRNREEWLTDEQLEQLTQDIEKIAKEHN